MESHLKQIAVAIGIIVHDSLVLICQRPEQGRLAGLWEFPGGKRQADETIEQCLHRELKEELDIDVEIAVALPPIEHEYPDLGVTLYPFVCHWTAGQPREIACQQFLWVAPAKLGDYSFPPANGPLIERIQAELSDPILGAQQELDSVRIGQIARATQAALRLRSYYLVGASACAVMAMDLIWRAARRYKLEGSASRPVVYVAAAALFAWLGLRLWLGARAAGRQAIRQPPPEPGVPPDFSTLSDGSHIVKNLERMP